MRGWFQRIAFSKCLIVFHLAVFQFERGRLDHFLIKTTGKHNYSTDLGNARTWFIRLALEIL
jgi:hypothetical protein